jgi:hypothetical protein
MNNQEKYLHQILHQIFPNYLWYLKQNILIQIPKNIKCWIFFQTKVHTEFYTKLV